MTKFGSAVTESIYCRGLYADEGSKDSESQAISPICWIARLCSAVCGAVCSVQCVPGTAVGDKNIHRSGNNIKYWTQQINGTIPLILWDVNMFYKFPNKPAQFTRILQVSSCPLWWSKYLQGYCTGFVLYARRAQRRPLNTSLVQSEPTLCQPCALLRPSPIVASSTVKICSWNSSALLCVLCACTVRE